jgi:hypothetical protein
MLLWVCVQNFGAARRAVIARDTNPCTRDADLREELDMTDEDHGARAGS